MLILATETKDDRTPEEKTTVSPLSGNNIRGLLSITHEQVGSFFLYCSYYYYCGS